MQTIYRTLRTGVAHVAAVLSLFWCSSGFAQLHVDAENGFRVTAPRGWGNAPLKGRMVWHSARNGGTEMPDCGVIVNADRSFVGLSNDDYIRSQSEAQLAKLLALNFADVKIGLFEPRSSLGKQRSLHYIYTGVLDGKKQTSLGFQTIYRQRLYTFFCNATADEFSYLYADLLAIADSLSFK